MTPPPGIQPLPFTLCVAALYALPALVWAILTRQMWEYTSQRRPESLAFRMMPLVTGTVAVHYGLLMGVALAPLGIDESDPWRFVASPVSLPREVSWLVALALLRHLLRLLPMPERRPSALWLAVNYGIAGGAAVADVWVRLVWTGNPMVAHHVFEVAFTILIVMATLELWRVARPGPWGPEHAGELRRPDVVLIGIGATVAALTVPVLAVAGRLDLGLVLYEVVIGLAIAVPFALRMLSVVVTELAVGTALGSTALALLVAHQAVLSHLDPTWRPLIFVLTVVALGTAFVPGQRWLRGRVVHLLLRRSEHEQAELLSALQTLSPELGVEECCRRALAELRRVRNAPGAAVILRDGAAIVSGAFELAPIQAVWPRGATADSLPAYFGSVELRELPAGLREALTRADVGLGVYAVTTPRRRWGHLFLRTGLLGGAFDEPEVIALRAFSDQLALLLDGADLLVRTIAVERSLAHAEKLAAIGELAARVAHEIRNPITAARSLAQQLAREPEVQFGEELGIILGELERVERQVASLLRFARREEFRFAPVDLAELVRAAVTSLRGRLDAAAVDLALDLPAGVVANADGEKLRQVLANLLENALDALEGAPGRRRIAVDVAGANGHATLGVTDSGPGVPAEALPRLFEPFFSLKPHGTGLGLAIAKRTVDAHGGRIMAASRSGGGFTVAVELPLAGRAA